MHGSHDISDIDAERIIEGEAGESEKARPESPVHDEEVGKISERERAIYEHGTQKFSRLGWKRLTVVLIVEAIALGCLSIPSTFATLGMVPGVLCCVGIGFISIYTSYVIGQVKLKFPHIAHYGDAGRLMMGRFGYELLSTMLLLQLLLMVSSHTITGTTAFITITKSNICSILFAVVSAIILFLLAVPPSFSEMAILGYVDFASILAAVGITIIATGVQRSGQPGGFSSVNWSAWPREGVTFTKGFVSIGNIVFAYTFAMCQFSFMDEMHTPKDYVKSIWTLGLIEIFIYTMTGALVYRFVGQDVENPALSSAGELMSRIAYGIALPVIFISGSINSVVAGRLIHGRIFKNSTIRFVNTPMGWITWLAVITTFTILAWIIAEVVPFFTNLLSLSSSLFVSGLTFYFPPIMWFMFIRSGKWTSPKNLVLAALNIACLIIGLLILGAGTYASVNDIVSLASVGLSVGLYVLPVRLLILAKQKLKYESGVVGGVFPCTAPG